MTATSTITPTTDPLVRLDSGLIRGSDTGDTRTFVGIRYAEPPVGPMRWKFPLRVRPWEGVADATEPGNACPQEDFPGPTGEDCLFLNVTTPKTQRDEPLPVVVWLHGGGFVMGAGSLYDARRMASQGNVIVVTINYRLGIFGYFGHPGLEGSGNFGLADQIAALQWTQRNAAAFGGDPGNVTLAGQSAGAMSAAALLTSPASEGLFHKAVLASGTCMLDWPNGVFVPRAPAVSIYSALEQTESLGAGVAHEMGFSGVDAVEFLRAVPTDELLAHNQKFANGLAYHTPLLPMSPARATELGLFREVPVMSGGTRDEMRPFIGAAASSEPITAERYPELVRNSFGDNADDVIARYPLSDYPSPATAWATIAADASWAFNILTGNRLMARHVPVYAYEFADRTAPNVNELDVPGLPMGAAHAADLPYLFDILGVNMLTPDQQELGRTMVDYWTTFAHTGDPNGPNTPLWSPFDGDEPVLRFDLGVVAPGPYTADHHCDFWRSLLRTPCGA